VTVNSLQMTIKGSLVDKLRHQIRTGELLPGSRLRQVDVAARFNVSTTPVREAFAALEREGLVVSSPHRGVTVFDPTVEDLKEMYEIRIPLEALATEIGVSNMTDADIAAMEDLLDQMDQAGDDMNRLRMLNTEFHLVLYRAAKRPRLVKLIGDLREASAAYLQLYATMAPTTRDTHAEHELILDACKRRAPKRAAKLMAAHLERTVEYVSCSLEH
jgi:DNA-binding GntR family transcriptional regulator